MSSHDSNALSVGFSVWGTARNCKEPCRESMESGKSEECCVWAKRSESYAKNGLVRCHSGTAKIPLPTDLVVCVAQNYEVNGWLPDSILWWFFFWSCGSYLWCIRPQQSKKTVKITSTLFCTCPAFLFLFLASGTMIASTVTTASWFLGCTCKPETHHQWSRCSGSQWSTPLPDGIASAPSLTVSARFS